jgi:hypothetical protein
MEDIALKVFGLARDRTAPGNAMTADAIAALKAKFIGPGARYWSEHMRDLGRVGGLGSMHSEGRPLDSCRGGYPTTSRTVP